MLINKYGENKCDKKLRKHLVHWVGVNKSGVNVRVSKLVFGI